MSEYTRFAGAERELRLPLCVTSGAQGLEKYFVLSSNTHLYMKFFLHESHVNKIEGLDMEDLRDKYTGIQFVHDETNPTHILLFFHNGSSVMKQVVARLPSGGRETLKCVMKREDFVLSFERLKQTNKYSLRHFHKAFVTVATNAHNSEQDKVVMSETEDNREGTIEIINPMLEEAAGLRTEQEDVGVAAFKPNGATESHAMERLASGLGSLKVEQEEAGCDGAKAKAENELLSQPSEVQSAIEGRELFPQNAEYFCLDCEKCYDQQCKHFYHARRLIDGCGGVGVLLHYNTTKHTRFQPVSNFFTGNVRVRPEDIKEATAHYVCESCHNTECQFY